MDSDDEKVEPVAGKRMRKETASASRKLEKDGHDGKSKKRARVLVEVMIDDIFVFYLLVILSLICNPFIHIKTVPTVWGFSFYKELRALHHFFFFFFEELVRKSPSSF